MCMIKLPFWRLTNKTPAFYDSESGTAIEQTAKVYAAVQELQEEFEKFTADTTKAMEEFQSQLMVSNCEFRKNICEIMENYIVSIDHSVDEATAYMKTNLESTATDLINEAIKNGTILVDVAYNEATEEVNIVATGGV